jgi:2-keto-3-deoxy-L-arabinonate dehydratase
VEEYFRTVADVVDIPIMIQDAPLSGVNLSAAFLARLATTIPQVQYAKVEMPGAAAKLRAVIERAGNALPGSVDGEESITLIPDLDAGATGTMPSSMIPDILRRVVDHYRAGRRDAAIALYEKYLPLINYENKQCGLRATKALMREGGIITSEAVRHPIVPLPPAIRAGLVELARRLDPLILHWNR